MTDYINRKVDLEVNYEIRIGEVKGKVVLTKESGKSFEVADLGNLMISLKEAIENSRKGSVV
jgi:hypothetical protein